MVRPLDITRTVSCLVALAFGGCALRPKPVYLSGGDGASYQTAVVVHAPDLGSGFDPIMGYFATHFPKYRWTDRWISGVGDKVYFVYELSAPHRKKQKVWFDITEASEPSNQAMLRTAR
jgi:hypothetical protein